MAGPSTPLIIVACILGLSFLWVPVGTAAPQDSQSAPVGDSEPGTGGKAIASPPGFYVGFRAARIRLYGHSYVAYGRLDARRQPVDFHYADLHPMGNYAVMDWPSCSCAGKHRMGS